jgi:DNA-binding NarL/FixJ family response regulator
LMAQIREIDKVIRSFKREPYPLGLGWVDCPRSLTTAGLVQALEGQARVHVGPQPPGQSPSFVILWAGDQENLAEMVERHQRSGLDAPKILVFGSHLDLPMARQALMLGTSGFIHAGMTPDQLVRAVTVAERGELVAPREMVKYLISREMPASLNGLSARQREILELVVEGRSNAEIAKTLYLSESTIKQHLRAAYKLLEVSNRTEAAKLIRDSY